MKKLSKWLTSLLVIAMALTMFGSSALAAAPTAATFNIKASKALAAADKVPANADKFSAADTYVFTIAEATDGLASIGGGLSAPTWNDVTLPSSLTTIVTGNIYTTTPSNTFGEMTFKAPGVYTFNVTETDWSNKNLTISAQTAVVKVYVTYAANEDGSTNYNALVATATYKVTPAAATEVEKQDNAKFTNTLNTDTTSIALTKVVTGDAGNQDPSYQFNFTIKLIGVTGKYSYTITRADGTIETGSTITAASGASSTAIALAHGDSVVVTGLPKTATYTITETKNDAYSTTAASTVSADIASTTIAGDVNIAGTVAGQTVTFTNDATADIPTAFVMNNWPYIALGIFAIAAIAIVLKKKSTKETF